MSGTEASKAVSQQWPFPAEVLYDFLWNDWRFIRIRQLQAHWEHGTPKIFDTQEEDTHVKQK